ncbi:MAG: hypothetical protein LBQ94_06780 [Treponema sp.]|jgi:uncharacterized membrane protein|nr:hypothetical protein [Treponema sp.]
MSKEAILDVVRILVFMFSWVVFTVSFLPLGGNFYINTSSNGFALLLCFTFTAWFEALSGLADNYDVSKGIRILNIVEITFGMLVLISSLAFTLIDDKCILSVIGLICSFGYFVLKGVRYSGICKDYIGE